MFERQIAELRARLAELEALLIGRRAPPHHPELDGYPPGAPRPPVPCDGFGGRIPNGWPTFRNGGSL